MYSARATTLLLLARLLPVVLGEELRPGDVPGACNIICGPIITLTNACDIDPAAGNGRQQSETGDNNDGDEAVEAQCVCKNTSFDVGKIASLCAACISQAPPPVSGKKTDDMDKIMSQCSFTSTTYTSTDTTAVTGIVVQATRPATGTTAGSNGAGTGATTSSGGTVRPSSTGTSAAGRLSDVGTLRLVLTAAGLLGVCVAMW